MISKIRLIDDYGYNTDLKVSEQEQIYTVEEILNVKINVYEDIDYKLELVSTSPLQDVQVYINGEKAEVMNLHGNTYKFVLADNQDSVFTDFLGFARLSVCARILGKEYWYHSEYVSIMVPVAKKSLAVDRMLKYIYNNQDDILKSNTDRINIGNDKKSKHDDFWSQIVLLDEIVKVYESCFGYFKANSRYKLETVEVVDRVEKLQNIDAKTIQYMVQHPELLRRGVGGIKYGKDSFLPNKTLMLQNKTTKNIYENQVVVGFLEKLLLDSYQLRKKIDEMIDSVPEEDENNYTGYIVSALILYDQAKKLLVEYKVHIREIITHLESLVGVYRRILPVDEYDCQTKPAPSPIFMTVPQYHRIYTCIEKWYGKTGFMLVKEKVMFGFLDVPEIYEAYVLTRLINHIKDCGYELKHVSHVEYPLSSGSLHKVKEYNNTFVFGNGSSAITLYYEPIIYNLDRSSVNGIGLYRNNSVSFSRNNEERVGDYYVPDYVIKIVSGEKEQYVICDAKYAKKDKVRFSLVPELAYKYLFSVSTINENATIEGMNILYGIAEDNAISESFYDRQTGYRIKPFAELIPMSELISEELQTRNFERILLDLI